MAKTTKQQLEEALERQRKEQEKIERLKAKLDEETMRSYDKSRKLFDRLIDKCIADGIEAGILEGKIEDLIDEIHAEPADEGDNHNETTDGEDKDVPIANSSIPGSDEETASLY